MGVLYCCCWRSSSALLTETPVSNTRQSHFKRNKREEVKKFYLHSSCSENNLIRYNGIKRGGRADVWEANKNWGAQKKKRKKLTKKIQKGITLGSISIKKKGKKKKQLPGAQQTRTHNSRRTRWKPTPPLGAGPFLSLFTAPLTHQPENEREKKTITIISHVFTLYAVSARPRNSSEL